MRKPPPLRPPSIRSLSVKTIGVVRLSALLGCVALAIIALAATPSSAGSMGQTLFAKAMSMITGGPASAIAPSEIKAARVNPALTLLAEAAPSPSSTMTVERRGHTATRLADGRVLIAGGDNSTGQLSDSEIFDPAFGTFSSSGSMTAARADHTAIKLSDGRVLVTGGRDGAGALGTSEIFDPSTGTFSSGPSMNVARAGHSATLLADGRVFIAGGDSGGSAEIYDPAANNFSGGVGSLGTARSMHSAALMLDGRIVIAGGRDGAGNALGSVEIFDAAGANFSTVDGALTVARVQPHLHVLFDGKVQIIGGNNDGSMEIYDPLIETIGAYAHVLPESDPCTGLINQILGSQTRAALFYAGSSDPSRDRSGHTITELTGSNQALLLGGANGSGAVLSSTSLLDSSSASVTTDKLDYAPGETATITGRGFQPGEIVRLKIHEDPHTPQERGFDAIADASGNFSGEYLVQDYDLAMKFIVGARGLTSGFTAQTTFTDSRTITSVTLNGGSSVTVAASASITAVVNVTTDNAGGNQNWRSTGWRISTTPGAVTCVNHTDHDGSGSYSETFNITAPATGGTFNAYFIAYSNDSCTQQPSTTFTLTNGVTVDAAFPTVLSINRANGSPTNLSNVTWQVTFSENVTGVDSTDFALVNTDLDSTPAIASVTQVTGSTYNVTASTGNGTGSLGLNLNDDDSIADTAGNKLGGTGTGLAGGGGAGNGSFTGQVYSLDRTLTPVITVDNKDYDGNTTATILTRSFTSNVPVTDDVQVNGGTANFIDASAGNGKTVNITGLTLIGADAARYIFSSTSATATADIDPAQVTATAGSGSGTYNGMTQSPSACVVSGAYIGGLSCVNNPASVGPGIGTSTISPITSGADLANFIVTPVDGSYTIDPALVTATAGSGSGTYNGMTQSPSACAVTGAYIGGLSCVNSPASVGPGVGTTTISPITSGADLANFTVTPVDGSYTIDQRLATWTTNANSKTYGDLDPVPLTTGSGSNFIAADNVTATYSRVGGENASPPTYHITATLSATGDLNNYIITNDGGEFTINKAPTITTVTFEAGPYVYRGTQFTATATVTGAGGLSQAVTPVNYTGDCTNVTLMNGCTASATYAESANHLSSSDTKSITILKAPSTTLVTFEPGPYVFRGTPFTATAQATGAGGLNASVPIVYTGDCTFVTTPNGCTATATYAESSNHLGSSDNESITILTACSSFNGFLPPIGGAYEFGTGGSYSSPVRSFKLNSTIPVKFNAMCFGAPLTTGIHTLQAIKYSNAMMAGDPIDATPTDAATSGNQFRLTGTDWHFNLSTKGFGSNGQGIWLFKATLFDGSTYSVWVEIKK